MYCQRMLVTISGLDTSCFELDICIRVISLCQSTSACAIASSVNARQTSSVIPRKQPLDRAPNHTLMKISLQRFRHFDM